MVPMSETTATLRSRVAAKGKRELTLFELLSFIVVICILIAVAIPVYGSIQDTARKNAVELVATEHFIVVKSQLAKGETTPVGTSDYSDDVVIEIAPTDPALEFGPENLLVTASWRDEPEISAYHFSGSRAEAAESLAQD